MVWTKQFHPSGTSLIHLSMRSTQFLNILLNISQLFICDWWANNRGIEKKNRMIKEIFWTATLYLTLKYPKIYTYMQYLHEHWWRLERGPLEVTLHKTDVAGMETEYHNTASGVEEEQVNKCSEVQWT